MEQYDAVAGILGFIPRGLERALLTSKHNPEYLTTNIMQKISDILANTALEAFRRYQAWKRKKKYLREIPVPDRVGLVCLLYRR